jgi:hypothetical protein
VANDAVDPAQWEQRVMAGLMQQDEGMDETKGKYHLAEQIDK